MSAVPLFRRRRERGPAPCRRWRLRPVVDAVVIALAVLGVALLPSDPDRAAAATAPAGQGFTVTPADLAFILKQIRIAEHHAATQTASNPCGTLVGPGPDQIPDRLTSYGLRTVDGSCNNLFAGRERFASADEPFPRLTKPKFRDAEGAPAGFFGRGVPVPASSSYANKGDVFDTQPRVISNLIVDQTSTNPAAVEAALHPVRTQGNEGVTACTADPPAPSDPPGCVPPHKTLFIPNVTTDVGLSPPFNSMFTFFGQFFDHGVDQTVKSGATVFVPLRADDPLITLGPDGKPNTGDEVPPGQRFMVLTRAQNQPGPDGILGTADDVQDASNTDTPWVDQSQTYTSHPSHQVFLREYQMSAGRPVDTGKLLGDPARALGPDGLPGTADDLRDSGMATWASVKQQAKDKLGLLLADKDVTDVPMLAADPYGNFVPGPHGLPQYVLKDNTLVEGNLADPVPVPANVRHFDTPFLTDIAHNADPTPVDTDHNPATPPVAPVPDTDKTASADFAHQPAGTYDDEMLDAHFCAGDGRVNENIALSAVHQIFHSEHDRLVDYIGNVLENDTSPSGVAALAAWKADDGPAHWNYGQKLFQAARFVTEMEYQHLVFEEFARKVVPAIRPFHVYHSDIDAAIPAEFAHAVYRFGHSMLDDEVARKNEDGTTSSLPLLNAFLNPPAYYEKTPGTPANPATSYTPQQAAGAIFMGGSDQTGNEIDEFVTETLRNNLLGLPLDLPTINMARAREAGVPPLNILRRQIFADTNDAQLAPYTSWSDFGQHLKHPESLVNFVAAYGTHPTIRDSGPDGILKDDPATASDESADNVLTVAAKRAAAKAIVDPAPTDTTPIPGDAADFMFGTGAWADKDGLTSTGVDDIDLWVGGLAEVTNLFGGHLGTTFNYVFQKTLENLQDGDRLYYLARTPGLNLRAQLEGNTFAEMVQRNTDGTNTLKSDVFATADCKFQLANLAGTPAGFTQFGSTVADDPGTPDCDESRLLLRKPDGTIQYRARNSVDPPGINGQSVYNGTPGVDRILGGNDNDTFWGGDGKDVIDGQGGDDTPLGGDGNDVITDLDGADVLKGGPGNDALDAGPGDDLNLGGDGSDFTNGGANDNETFGGPGGDFINAGQGADAVFGDGGDDWIEGGSGQDLLQGDHGAPFFDDPGQVKPGNDVFVGQVGENDYDAEGGDDLMAQNSAIDRNAGAGGFDWAFHQYDTVGADDDMKINQNLAELALPVVVNRDRWQETEADSGSAFDDVIRGDDEVPAGDPVAGVPPVGGAGFTGCDVLDQAGVNRIKGLAALLPQPLTGDLGPVEAASATGSCPLSGPIWGEGNILLGGAGSDLIEGRGGDDVIDGDKALQVRISVRTDPADPSTEIGSTDLMEHQYLRDANGNPTGPTLQAAVFNGDVDPGNLVVVREIVDPQTTASSVDTAVFSGPRSNYTVTEGPTFVRVTQTGPDVAGQKVSDGTDILRNVEVLKFADETVASVPAAAVAPASLAFGQQPLGTTSPAQTVTLSNTGPAPLNIASVALAGPDAAHYAHTNGCGATLAPNATCTITVRFHPTATRALTASLVVTDDDGGDAGSTQSVALSGTGVLVNAPSSVTIDDATPARGQTLTATVADGNGVPATGIAYQWEETAPNAGPGAASAPIPGATARTFVVGAQQNNRRLRVVATFTDLDGFAETATSALTSPVTPTANTDTGPTPVPGAPAGPAAATPAPGGAGPAAPSGPGAPGAPSAPAGPSASGPPSVAALRATGLSVSLGARQALSVRLTAPAGARTARLRVFRLGRGGGRSAAAGARARRTLLATVVRRVAGGRRQTVRLTHRALRRLRPGRYLVEVRVGRSRAQLGPATTRVFVVKARARRR